MIGQDDLYLHDFHPNFKNISFSINIILNGKKSNVDLWHNRLRHPSTKTSENIRRYFPYLHSI